MDVKALFGALSVKDTQTIDLVIRLEDWDKDKEYDRLGLEENYTEYLGNKVVSQHPDPSRTESGGDLRDCSYQSSSEKNGIQCSKGIVHSCTELFSKKT